MSASPQPYHPVIRLLRAADIDAVLEIERASYPFPWTRGIFNECLRAGCACSGLQIGLDLVGYSIHHWGAGESHLLNLCVHPAWQRRGLGSMLLENAIAHARSLECASMLLEVRPSNPGAVAMYRRRGFRIIGRRAGYYRAEHGREDAVVMRLDLD